MKTLKNSSNFLQRIQRVREHLNGQALLVEDLTDLHYLTGLVLSTGLLLIHPIGELLFVDGRYAQSAREGSPCEVKDLTAGALQEILLSLKVDKLSILPKKILLSRYLELQKTVALLPLEKDPVERVRMVKEPAELEALRMSAKLGWLGFTYLEENLRAGMRESDAVLLYETFCRQHGASKLAFDPIIAFGEGGAKPHYKSGERRLKRGDSVLVDAGITLNGYHSDMTRTFFFGKPSVEMEHLYERTFAAYSAAIRLCKAGVSVAEIDLAAREAMGDMEGLFLHSLGHGIGQTLHEPPRISSKTGETILLEEGMVCTIEPGLYLAGVGGVRYEDTIIITKEGYENLYPEGYNPYK